MLWILFFYLVNLEEYHSMPPRNQNKLGLKKNHHILATTEVCLAIMSSWSTVENVGGKVWPTSVHKVAFDI